MCSNIFPTTKEQEYISPPQTLSKTTIKECTLTKRKMNPQEEHEIKVKKETKKNPTVNNTHTKMC